MKLKSFEEIVFQTPFAPFVINIDGKSIPVEHPDQVLFNKERTTVVVAPSDNSFHIIDVDQVNFLTVRPRRKAAVSAK